MADFSLNRVEPKQSDLDGVSNNRCRLSTVARSLNQFGFVQRPPNGVRMLVGDSEWQSTTCPPFAWPKVDHRFDHVQRGGIKWRIRSTSLSDNHLDFRKSAEHHVSCFHVVRRL